MRILVIVLIGLGLSCVSRADGQSTSPPLWNGLVPGQFGIGFRRLEGGRTHVDVWYPTAAVGAHATYSEYVGTAAASLTSFLKSTGIGDVTIDSLLKSPMMAIAGAVPVAVAFPLVLFSHGNRQDAADQAVLGEYLASHGFVVASTPSPMLRTPMEREGQIGQFADEQANDLSAAVAVVARSIPADTSRLFVVSHSFGARSALLLSMQNRRVSALVSLDGGIGTATGIDELRAAPSFRTGARVPALMHAYEELDAFMKPDMAFLRSLQVDTLILHRVESMHHVHFTTYGFASAVFPEIARVTRATSGTATDVRQTAERVLEFIRSRSTR